MKYVHYGILILYVILGLLYQTTLRKTLNATIYNDARIPEEFQGHVYYFLDKTNLFINIYGVTFLIIVLITGGLAIVKRKKTNDKIFWTMLLGYNGFWIFWYVWQQFQTSVGAAGIF